MTPLLAARQLVLDVPGRGPGAPLDFVLAGGKMVAILGANGSGKTTLLHTLAGLRTPRSGTVLLAGRAIGAWSSRARAQRLGLLFQDDIATFPATVEETVAAGRFAHQPMWRNLSSADRQAITDALAVMQLGDLAQRPLEALSGGERRRVALATLLAQDPPVMLLDEPVNHLDWHHQILIMDHLARLTREADKTALVSLHDPNLAARYCEHVLLLGPDGAAQWGPAAELLTAERLGWLYRHPFACLDDGGVRVFVPR
ncbi:MAG: ABC transporter ATP-binding protein [Pseudomonadota bacterium]